MIYLSHVVRTHSGFMWTSLARSVFPLLLSFPLSHLLQERHCVNELWCETSSLRGRERATLATEFSVPSAIVGASSLSIDGDAFD